MRGRISLRRLIPKLAQEHAAAQLPLRRRCGGQILNSLRGMRRRISRDVSGESFTGGCIRRELHFLRYRVSEQLFRHPHVFEDVSGEGHVFEDPRTRRALATSSYSEDVSGETLILSTRRPQLALKVCMLPCLPDSSREQGALPGSSPLRSRSGSRQFWLRGGTHQACRSTSWS